MQVDKTLEAELHVEAPSDVLDTSVPTRRSSQKSILALSVFALGLNAAAAVYTVSPSDFALPDVSVLAELLPHQKASEPKPDPVVAALDDIQSIQQRHVSLLQETTSSLQQNASLLQQDSIALASLRQSVTDGQVDVKKISAQIADEHVDVKKISTQISSLIAKVDCCKMHCRLSSPPPFQRGMAATACSRASGWLGRASPWDPSRLAERR